MLKQDTSEHHHEKSQNRSRWDMRYTSHKREARKRCLVSTKSHTVVSTSKSGDDVKDKTNDKCKDSEPNKHCVTNTIVRKQSNVSTSDNFKENAHDNSTNNISLNECDKIKDLNKESCELEKDKKSETAVGEENKSVLKQTMKLNDRKNDVNNIDSKNKHSACNDIQPKDKIESATNTLNSNKSNKPEKQCASVDKDSNKAIIQCNDLELNKTDNKISTQSKPKEDAQLHETSLDNAPSNSAESILVAADNDTSIQGVHLDELNLDNVSSNSAESILVTVDNDTPIHGVRLDELSLDNVSSNSAESILTPAEGDNQDLVEGTTLKYMPVSKRTSVPEEQNDSVQDKDKCHPLPAEFPVWRPTPKELKYQNPFMSVREIDSDEETVCFDDFITLDKIDTTKSYLENLSPEFDDYRVIDMILGTPSPPKRKHDEDDVVTKKRKYDHLYAEINSDQLLNEINKVFKEDKQNSESTTTRCIKRNRSKSLCTMPTKKYFAQV
ncbi:hypothetical protein NQ314_008352 [Rhamnusium bicolor]|uniref:Uncharacterized protein n=1 Tax=Rhamnusium bicolor TaxID=1586634 RepID=A0AAV8YEB4_9CUCU|nr:hypothetical protein NQ314_008352 [Rhamnusium bicolor]